MLPRYAQTLSSRLSAPAGDFGQPVPLAEFETSGLGCSCPSTGCQEGPGLSGPQRPLDHRLSSPGLPTAWMQQSFPVFTFRSVFRYFLSTPPTGTCPIVPVPVSPSGVFLSFISYPKAERSYFNQEKKKLQTLSTVASSSVCANARAHTQTHRHLFSLSLSPSHPSPSDRLLQEHISPRVKLSKIFSRSRKSDGGSCVDALVALNPWLSSLGERSLPDRGHHQTPSASTLPTMQHARSRMHIGF